MVGWLGLVLQGRDLAGTPGPIDNRTPEDAMSPRDIAEKSGLW